MAVNQPNSAPQLSVSPVWFDGEALRISSRAMTARVANLQRDPRVAIAILDHESGDSMVVTGRAELRYGEQARVEPVASTGPSDELSRADRAAPAIASGDLPVLIVVRPERVVRRGPHEPSPRAGEGG
jgi:hypothetical protein